MKAFYTLLTVMSAAATATAVAVPDRTANEGLSPRAAESGPPIPSCTTFTIKASVERTTVTQLSADGDGYTIELLYAIMDRKVLKSGSYDMEAVLCTPTGNPTKIDRSETIQLYVHGATLNKLMWDFPYKPEIYSWTRYMTSQGYTTLTFDTIGAGNSTVVDGLLEANGGTLVQIIHKIVGQLRGGEIGGKKWKKIVPMGFSLGSAMLISLADLYPNDVDTVIIHGYSWNAGLLYPGYLAGFQTSAAIIDPVKWGNYSPQYLTQLTPAARKVAAFYGSYDQEVLPIDFELRDLNTLGEAMGLPFHSVTAHEFKGPVFLGIGNNDPTFCGQQCGIDPYELYPRFPKASGHTVKIYPETGHFIHLHHSGPQLMKDVTEFLTTHGL